MTKEIIITKNAPAPIGPYSQAVKAGGLLFCSGQIPIDPTTGGGVSADIETETNRVMENISAVLRAAGRDFSHIVKTTIFLTDMNDFAKVNEVYGSYFAKDFPARDTVQVAKLPKNVRVEISVIALAN